MKRLQVSAVVLALFAIPACPLIAQDSIGRTIYKSLVREAKIYASDAKALVLAPREWGPDEWRQAALLAGTVVAVGLADEEIDRVVQRNRSEFTNDLSEAVTPLGGGRGEQLSYAAIAGGLAFGNPKLRDLGRDALESQILAAHIATPLLKEVFGRQRPDRDQGSGEFEPFGGGSSFPSGHATSAFALASVVAGHADGWVVPAIAYSLAGTVAFARVNDRAHFASDTVAGAIVGAGIGRFIVRRHNVAQRSGLDWTIIPAIDHGERGVLVQLRF